MKIVVSSVALLPALFFGFGQEKDVEYFITHQDEIAITQKECETSLEYAVKAKDEERFKDILEDPECKAAQQATVKIRKQNIIAEQKQREEDARIFNAEKDKFINYLESLDFPELKKEAVRLRKECASISMILNNSFECVAFTEQKKQIENTLVAEIVNTTSYSNITTYMASEECSKSTFKVPYDCALNKAALKKSYEKVVDTYSKDRNLVIYTYNQCVDIYKKLKSEQGYKEARNADKTESCQGAKGAAKKLSLLKPTQMNFRSKIQ